MWSDFANCIFGIVLVMVVPRLILLAPNVRLSLPRLFDCALFVIRASVSCVAILVGGCKIEVETCARTVLVCL